MSILELFTSFGPPSGKKVIFTRVRLKQHSALARSLAGAMVFTELLKQMTCHSLYGHPLAAAATTMQLAHWNFVLHSLTQVGWFEDKEIKSPLYTYYFWS